MTFISFLRSGLAAIILLASSHELGAQTFSPMRVTPLPQPVQMHGSAVIGDRLYVFGGEHESDGFTKQSLSAPILTGGTLGQWREETPIPEYRHYTGQSVEVVNDTVYIIGGSLAPEAKPTTTTLKFLDDVLYNRIGPDGKLGQWKRSARFGSSVSMAACGSTDKHLYVVGGAVGRNPKNVIFFAPLLENGDLGPWKSGGSLPVPLWFHGAAIMDNRMYVWGGLSGSENSTVNGNVYYASINSDGTLGAWQQTKPMPQPVYSSVFCGFNDHLVCVAGRYKGALPHNDIWYAPLVNGEVTSWQKIATDLDTRLYVSLGLDKTHGYIFINGGRYRLQPGTTGPSHFVKEVAAFKISSDQARVASATRSSATQASGFNPASLPALSQVVGGSKKPILVYFHSPEVPGCKRFEEAVLGSQIPSLQSKYTVAVVDSSKDSPTTAKYNVFRVPTVAVLEPGGKLKKASLRLQTAEDLQGFLSKL